MISAIIVLYTVAQVIFSLIFHKTIINNYQVSQFLSIALSPFFFKFFRFLIIMTTGYAIQDVPLFQVLIVTIISGFLSTIITIIIQFVFEME
ncbi:hypothetical protein WA1_20630 [Scytonema hofmannii PCC 7110]|uniref:Uncharacterized protein n=1 Tax=Scytonema hofmannii PCC 7110 TaxID=128403 RepID=A0A139XCF3_9CYAN|nr:hypothetical protein WA1_20630 [Scytonema hofmannii PCC 7110]